MEIEIKRCEVGRRKSTSITGQAVVQGTEGKVSVQMAAFRVNPERPN